MVKCDSSRSLAIGFITALVMGIILLLWFGIDMIKQMDITRKNILFLFIILWFIGTSMDYFNQCYTICDNFNSSLKYGIFVVTLIHLIFAAYVNLIDITVTNVSIYLLNVMIITGLHYATCKLSLR